MRKTRFTRVLVMSLVMALTLSMTAAVAAIADDVESVDDSVFSIFDDLVTQNKAIAIMELVQKAEDGDMDAFRELQFISKDVKDVFPEKDMVGKDWFNAAGANPANWGIRKFSSVNIPTGDSGARMQAASTGLVPYRDPAGVFSTNILVGKDVGTPFQNEPDICVNPEDDQNVIIVSHNYGVRGAPAQVSFDGGESWRGPYGVPITNLASFSGDPVLACARNNKTYFNFMSIGSRTRMLRGFAVNITKSDIAVSTSNDGGITWENPSIVSTNKFEYEEYIVELTHPITGEKVKIPVPVLAISFLDKNWMTVGPDPNNPDKDILYVSYTNFTSYMIISQPLPGIIVITPLQWTSEIEIFESSDEAKSWTKVPVMDPVPAIGDIEDVLLSDSTGVVSYRTVQGSQLAVGEDGTVYAAWYDSTNDGYAQGKGEMYVTRSLDKGKNWSEPTVAAESLEVPRTPVSTGFRNTNSPSLAVGPDNDVYIAYASRTKGKLADEGDVYLVHGIWQRNGFVFDDPLKVNKDKTNNLQFFIKVAVGPDGIVHTMWGDARDDPLGLKYHIYYTKSEDKGKTVGFKVGEITSNEVRVTDFPSNPNKCFPRGRFIGDYFGMTVTAGDVFMVWTDCRLGEYGPVNSKIGFARRTAIPGASIILTPSAGPSGQEVTIQVFNFQPDVSVFVQIGGDISACGGRTNDSGFTECKVLMPIMASKGIQDVIVFDESGLRSEASFIADVGIDDLARKDSMDSNEVTESQDDNDVNLYLLFAVLAFTVVAASIFLPKLLPWTVASENNSRKQLSKKLKSYDMKSLIEAGTKDSETQLPKERKVYDFRIYNNEDENGE